MNIYLDNWNVRKIVSKENWLNHIRRVKCSTFVCSGFKCLQINWSHHVDSTISLDFPPIFLLTLLCWRFQSFLCTHFFSSVSIFSLTHFLLIRLFRVRMAERLAHLTVSHFFVKPIQSLKTESVVTLFSRIIFYL